MTIPLVISDRFSIAVTLKTDLLAGQAFIISSRCQSSDGHSLWDELFISFEKKTIEHKNTSVMRYLMRKVPAETLKNMTPIQVNCRHSSLV